MVFQNRMDQLDFPKQQQKALDMLRDFMILKSITVIEYDDLFVGDTIFNNEPDLAMFRYKKKNKLWATKIWIMISRCRFQKVCFDHSIL